MEPRMDVLESYVKDGDDDLFMLAKLVDEDGSEAMALIVLANSNGVRNVWVSSVINEHIMNDLRGHIIDVKTAFLSALDGMLSILIIQEDDSRDMFETSVNNEKVGIILPRSGIYLENAKDMFAQKVGKSNDMETDGQSS